MCIVPDLKEKTVEELRQLASMEDIVGRSKMNKAELVSALYRNSQDTYKERLENHASSSRANRNTHYFVKNINGTSKEPYTGVRWLEGYRQASKSKRKVCARNGCDKKVSAGAHVQIKDGRVSRSWYIIPLCASCNNAHNTEEMEIAANVTLVPVTEIRELMQEE
ncbi:HNH endonuclease [Balamuthia mandrillaris]